jgi:hypothetical protein
MAFTSKDLGRDIRLFSVSAAPDAEAVAVVGVPALAPLLTISWPWHTTDAKAVAMPKRPLKKIFFENMNRTSLAEGVEKTWKFMQKNAHLQCAANA